MNIIDPKVDIVFKRIFSNKDNEDLLKWLINSIVSKDDQVEEIEIHNPYTDQEYKDDKPSILDIKTKSGDGRMFNIEIQVRGVWGLDEGEFIEKVRKIKNPACMLQ